MEAVKEDWYLNYGVKKIEETRQIMNDFLKTQQKDSQENKDLGDQMLETSKEQYEKQIRTLNALEVKENISKNKNLLEFFRKAKSTAKQSLDLNCETAFTIIRVNTHK